MAKVKRCAEASTLHSLRNASGWSQKKLAVALGMDEKKLCRYETSETLSRDELDFLVAPLGFPPESVEEFLAAHPLRGN